MAKVLRCPECGADGDSLQAEQDAVIIYDIEVDPSDPDGIKTSDRQQASLDGWSIHCGQCGESNDGDSWLERWLVDAEEGK